MKLVKAIALAVVLLAGGCATGGSTAISDPTRYQSHWPGNAGYGAGGATARPRAATVMVAKDNGGRVGT